MKYQIDEKNWGAYRTRVLNNEKFTEDQKKYLKKQFSKAHRLMEKMIENESNDRLLTLSMRTLQQFLTTNFRLTGISATPSNFIVYDKEASYEESREDQ